MVVRAVALGAKKFGETRRAAYRDSRDNGILGMALK